MLKVMLSPFAERAYALLRIVSGLLFAVHGMQKIFGILTERTRPALWSQGWFGGMIELIAGIAIAVGLFTRWAAFVASGTMAVAYFQFHNEFTGMKFIPVVNGGELAVLYCFLFLFIACKGGGMCSVDSKREQAAKS